MKNKKKAVWNDIYVACEDVDFVWKVDQVADFDRLWKEGYRDLEQLSRYFKRSVPEVSFLVWDRAQSGRISKVIGKEFR